MSWPAFTLPVLILFSGFTPVEPPEPPGYGMPQVMIHQRIIIRIPRVPNPAAAMPRYSPPRVVRWREHGSQRCIETDRLVGAALDGSTNVDLVLNDGRRLRAELDHDCPALDFYSGFYLTRTDDGKQCAKRDSIHSRAGSTCEIRRMRWLEPE